MNNPDRNNRGTRTDVDPPSDERRAMQPDDDPVTGPTAANLLHEEQGAEDTRLENQGELVDDDLQGRRGSGIPAVDDVRSDNIDEQTQARR